MSAPSLALLWAMLSPMVSALLPAVILLSAPPWTLLSPMVSALLRDLDVGAVVGAVVDDVVANGVRAAYRRDLDVGAVVELFCRRCCRRW
jgi:hypothetical protein